jgi:hypothetical protein
LAKINVDTGALRIAVGELLAQSDVFRGAGDAVTNAQTALDWVISAAPAIDQRLKSHGSMTYRRADDLRRRSQHLKYAADSYECAETQILREIARLTSMGAAAGVSGGGGGGGGGVRGGGTAPSAQSVLNEGFAVILGSDQAGRGAGDLYAAVPGAGAFLATDAVITDISNGDFGALVGDGAGCAAGFVPLLGTFWALADSALELGGYPTFESTISRAIADPGQFGSDCLTGADIIARDTVANVTTGVNIVSNNVENFAADAAANVSTGVNIVGNTIESGCNTVADFLFGL